MSGMQQDGMHAVSFAFNASWPSRTRWFQEFAAGGTEGVVLRAAAL